MGNPFTRQLGKESGVQLNPLVDNSEIPVTDTADQSFGIVLRSTRGRIDRAFSVDRSNVETRLGNETNRVIGADNEAVIQVVEALNNGAYSAVVQRLVGDDSVVKYAVASFVGAGETVIEPDPVAPDAHWDNVVLAMPMDQTGEPSWDEPTITSGTLPSHQNWQAIAWNGTVFCAVASYSNVAATSPDGITWTQRTMSSSKNWQAIAWNGTVFCAVASYSVAVTSPDGITWTERTLPISRNWQAIAWNGTVFCVVASYSDIAVTSPDGITWTERTMSSHHYWQAIAWNGTVFCAITSGFNVAATSPDGITWTERTLPIAQEWYSIAGNGTVFCAIAFNSSVVVTSPDGITWTQRTLPSAGGWHAIAGNGTLFCVVAYSSSVVVTSPDGITWTQRTLPSYLSWHAIAGNGTLFCTIANSTNVAATITPGYAFTDLKGHTITNTGAVISTAQSKFGGASGYFDGDYVEVEESADFAFGTDLFTIEGWARPAGAGTVAETRTLLSLGTYETESYLAIEHKISAQGASSLCASTFKSDADPYWDNVVLAIPMDQSGTPSWNAPTITQMTLLSSGNWQSIAWNGTVFCAIVKNSATAATSSDGVTWTLRTLPVSLNWASIIWNGTVFCAVAMSSSQSIVSTNGIDWTIGTMPVSANWYDVAWNGTVFCAIVYGPTTVAATSTNGIVWTPRTMPVNEYWSAIASNGSIFCAIITGHNKAYTSSDGVTWTAQTLPASTGWSDIAWNGSVFCIIQASDLTTAATSPNGIAWTARTLPAAARWDSIASAGSVFCAVSHNTAPNKGAISSDNGVTWTSFNLLGAQPSYWSVASNGASFMTLAYSSAIANIIAPTYGFTDLKGHTITNTGAVISTAKSKFGGASGYFADASRWLTTSHVDYAFGTGDFTIEMFAYFMTVANKYFFSTEVTNGQYFYMGHTDAGALIVYGSHMLDVLVVSNILRDRWYHIAFTRASNVVRLFVDGVERANTTTTFNLTTQSLFIGGTTTGLLPSGSWMKGYIDDLRITKGVARYTANFTPPTKSYLTSATPTYSKVSTAEVALSAVDPWKFFALQRNGTALTLAVDGVAATPLTLAVNHAFSANKPILIGAGSDATGTASGYYSGYLDDLRITKGVARYAFPFDRPTIPFWHAIVAPPVVEVEEDPEGPADITFITAESLSGLNAYLLAVKHLECFNDGIRIEIHADEKRENGSNIANDYITLNILDRDSAPLYAFYGSLRQDAVDDYGQTAFLPNVVASQTDLVEVNIPQAGALQIAPESFAYGYRSNGLFRSVKSGVLNCFIEDNPFTASSVNYTAACDKLKQSRLHYTYLASGGTQDLALLAQLAQLAFDTNRQLRFDVPGNMTVNAALAWTEQLNFSSRPYAHLLQAFWAPFKSLDYAGRYNKGYIGTSALNIAFACLRNAKTNPLGFAMKNYPIAGREWPISRLGIAQTVTLSGSDLNALARAKINPVVQENFTGGVRTVFRDSLTQADVESSQKMLISVVDMSTAIDAAVTSYGKGCLQLPMKVGIAKLHDFMAAYFLNAESSGWLVPSEELNGKGYRFDVRPNANLPYERMDVTYSLRYDGTARQIHVTQTLSK
jgi:hypothetical protein